MPEYPLYFVSAFSMASSIGSMIAIQVVGGNVHLGSR